MKYKKKTVVIGEVMVGECPACGCEPDIEVSTNLDAPFGPITVHHEVVCTACGLGAPLSVWNELCEKKWNNTPTPAGTR